MMVWGFRYSRRGIGYWGILSERAADMMAISMGFSSRSLGGNAPRGNSATED